MTDGVKGITIEGDWKRLITRGWKEWLGNKQSKGEGVVLCKAGNWNVDVATRGS